MIGPRGVVGFPKRARGPYVCARGETVALRPAAVVRAGAPRRVRPRHRARGLAGGGRRPHRTPADLLRRRAVRPGRRARRSRCTASGEGIDRHLQPRAGRARVLQHRICGRPFEDEGCRPRPEVDGRDARAAGSGVGGGAGAQHLARRHGDDYRCRRRAARFGARRGTGVPACRIPSCSMRCALAEPQ